MRHIKSWTPKRAFVDCWLCWLCWLLLTLRVFPWLWFFASKTGSLQCHNVMIVMISYKFFLRVCKKCVNLRTINRSLWEKYWLLWGYYPWLRASSHFQEQDTSTLQKTKRKEYWSAMRLSIALPMMVKFIWSR